MSFAFQHSDDPHLRRLARVKAPNHQPPPPLGPELLSFFKQNIEKRQAKFGPIAECWSRLVPQLLLDHTALESFTRGQLVVIVDSASHMFELKQLLLAGLQKQILVACKSLGLKKITLRRGTWYDEVGRTNADQRLRF